MPTRNRRFFVGQAVRYFLRQDYPHKELVVVDDGEDTVADLLPEDERVRYIRLKRRESLGVKRNLACEASSGELIAHWDDDDWMGINRLSVQVAHLQSAGVEVCGANELLHYRPLGGDAWLYRCQNRGQSYLAGCTLLYRRQAWEAYPFAPLDVGEDTSFLMQFPRESILAVPEVNWYVAIIHGGNTAAKNLADPSWQRRPLDEVSRLLKGDRAFYVALRNGHLSTAQDSQINMAHVAQNGQRSAQPEISPDGKRKVLYLPLVSCIMPTHNRRSFVPRAIKYFLEQDYPERELIVIDDGDDPVSDLMPPDRRIYYVHLPKQHTIGSKRNLACELAQGEIILLWDDDDWYGRRRISYQVAPLLERRADLTGLDQGLLLSLKSGQFWSCTSELHDRMFVRRVIGGTLTFWKQLWSLDCQFPNSSLAEDAVFLQTLVQKGARLERLANNDCFIYVRHEANSWQFTPGISFDNRGWQRADLPAFMSGEDLDFYMSLHRSVRG